jgi:hypothetical protein
MADQMDVGYVTQGEEGKQCKNCTEFTAHGDGSEEGECHEHPVTANGGCNKFNAK